MEDIERYGDYNEVDEAPGGKGNIVFLIIKVLVAVATVAVIGVLGFRIYFFNYYPFMNQTLTIYRTATTPSPGTSNPVYNAPERLSYINIL